ncbi:hypothetical protein LC605_25070 [Nostoc sp. CHAB 5836]|uniref:hypothetical protein n=1 Tax=Nostoc sp. CHAB 5836 TaxID=2780404 RepID=UPI001E36A33F|nr:hypothetical protein [Nostoc sp. CHAB 5836]MCC5618296.1 hypothetical protein [Nostoc sp. CHAB 5836]
MPFYILPSLHDFLLVLFPFPLPPAPCSLQELPKLRVPDLMKQQPELKQVNQSLGQNASIGILTGFQFAISLLSFGIGFFLASLLTFGIIWSILIGVWASATVLILSGKRPYLFWSRVFPKVPTWSRGYIKYSSPEEKKRSSPKKLPQSW